MCPELERLKEDMQSAESTLTNTQSDLFYAAFSIVAAIKENTILHHKVTCPQCKGEV